MPFFKKFSHDSIKKITESTNKKSVRVQTEYEEVDCSWGDNIKIVESPDNQSSWSVVDNEVSNEEPSIPITEQENRLEKESLTKKEEFVSENFITELVLLTILVLIPIFALHILIFILVLYKIKNYLINLRANKKLLYIEIDPFEIYFSQSMISNIFRNRWSLEDTIVELVEEKIKIEDIDIIQVCIIDDIFYLSNNRRLYCFQEAIR